MAKITNWKSILPASILPFKEDCSIDEAAFRKYLSWLANVDGVGGIVVNGHAGEVSVLSREERKRVVEIAVDEVGGRVMIVSGINSDSTWMAQEYAKDIEEAGAAGMLIMPCNTWLRYGVQLDMVVQYFTRICGVVGLDAAVHLYPLNTKAFYPVEILLELSKIANIKAIKLGTRSTGIYERDLRILREKAPHLSLLTCHDESLITSMFPGVDGALVGLGSCIPELICEAFKAMNAGDFREIRKYAEKIKDVSDVVYEVGQSGGSRSSARMAKYAAYFRGLIPNPIVREPVMPITQRQKDEIEAAIKKAGVEPVGIC